ncbi:MAG: hypothetical protein IH594_06450 [Bacteroidales bacterium]|nr:hypothetical protein [Bacteroidales bacterium]
MKFPLNGYKSGKIQWQFSKNQSDWINLLNGNSRELNYIITETGYFRAKVTYGNCEYFSDTTYIIASDSINCRKKTTVGAIRWDAGWVGDVSQISILSQRQLSPEKFRFRTPFFANIHKPDSITFKYSQSVMDKEIEYAQNSGINYWLYNWYPDNSGFDIPLDLHLSSIHKDDIKFCYIFHSKNWQYVKKELPLTMSRMKLSNYMKIDGKPLVFCMHDTWTPDDINELKNKAIEAGIPEIYLVIMEWTGDRAIQKCAAYGAQASSAYCNWGDGGISYSVMAAATETKWNTYKSSAFAFIPFVTTGWDPRPFIEFYEGLSEADSISLSKWYPKPADDHYVLTAASDEVAAHLKAGLDWVKNNPFFSMPNTVIIYAWNECTEGGFIIPVAETDSSAINYGTKRLDAIKEMLIDYYSK